MPFQFTKKKATLLLASSVFVISIFFFVSVREKPVVETLKNYVGPYRQSSTDSKKVTESNDIHPVDPNLKNVPAQLIAQEKTVYVTTAHTTVETTTISPSVVVKTETSTVVSTKHSVSTVYVDKDHGTSSSSHGDSQSPFLGHDIKPKENHLEYKNFRPKERHYFHLDRESNRMVSNEVWRDPESFPDDYYHTDNLRPQLPDISYYENKAQYMRQPIIKDYASNSNKMFVMMKTGATVMWNRLPIHFLTTFTRVPYFGIYSDMPASMGGYEVIDILANTTEKTKKTGAYRHYTTLQKFYHEHANADPAEGVDGHDGWSLDRHKNVPMLAHGYRTAPKEVEWFFFLDGDTFMFMDNLMDYLSTLDSSKPMYLGTSHWLYGERFAHGGSGVVLSRAALDKSLGEHPEWEWEMEEETSKVCCGDYMVKKMMDRIDVPISWGRMNNVKRKFNDEHYWSMYATKANWCDKVLGFHHVRPYEVELLWEYERSLTPEQKRNITYADMYRDFTAPYIKERMENWDSMAMETQFSKKFDKEAAERAREHNEKKQAGEKEKRDSHEMPSKDNSKDGDEDEVGPQRPWWSEKLCMEACQKDDKCISWRYLPNSHYCGISNAVRLGRAAHLGKLAYDEHEVDWDHRNAISGYMIERIRALRANQECDVMYKTTIDDDKKYIEDIKQNKVLDRYEGWGLRTQMKGPFDAEKKKQMKDLEEDYYKRLPEERKRILDSAIF